MEAWTYWFTDVVVIAGIEKSHDVTVLLVGVIMQFR